MATGKEAAVTSAYVRDDTLADIKREVGALSEGSVRVIGVRATRDWDREGDEQVRLVVTLADPEGDTWPSDEMTLLSQRVRRVGYVRGLDMSVTYTNPTSGTADETSDEGEFDGAAGE